MHGAAEEGRAVEEGGAAEEGTADEEAGATEEDGGAAEDGGVAEEGAIRLQESVYRRLRAHGRRAGPSRALLCPLLLAHGSRRRSSVCASSGGRLLRATL